MCQVCARSKVSGMRPTGHDADGNDANREIGAPKKGKMEA